MEQMNEDIENNTNNTNDDHVTNIQFTGTYHK